MDTLVRSAYEIKLAKHITITRIHRTFVAIGLRVLDGTVMTREQLRRLDRHVVELHRQNREPQLEFVLE